MTKAYDKLKRELDNLVAVENYQLSPKRWVGGYKCKAYIRLSPKYLGGVRCDKVLVLANITGRGGRGWFFIVLRLLEAYGYPVYIENVVEPRLCPILRKLGYSEIVDTVAPSFYRLPSQ